MVTFILFLIAIILIVFNVNAVKKENSGSFTAVLKERQDNINEYDIKLGEIRKEYAENITEVQKEIEELKKQISEITKKSEVMYDKIDNGVDEQKSPPKTDDKKSEEIKKLLKEGKSDDEICALTGLGKGEVLLIKGILKY
ncbi:MAG: hypothetical protein SPJ62_10435 [Inconstantimicrobium porci]|uniref:Uncharacterized protein n=1 Tax=Inconstantimicrobium porci TaxID=2652291 RepID=A0A7X2T1C7_9CLOT|nr:hypothetical protein [Inconstantimicrobium porci]MDD6772249.1 hypothetical protein [Inconstantimicrobium porci]MDY5912396.1 hypothetical protein [Inconstantimicrobium porci]MSR91095.1 hypothetical protein [Inconstantimicrobium porci]